MTKNDIAVVYGEHEYNLTPEVISQTKYKKVCLFCDQEVLFTGNETSIAHDGHSVENRPKGITTKYAAVACAREFVQSFAMLEMYEFLNHMKLHHGGGKKVG